MTTEPNDSLHAFEVVAAKADAQAVAEARAKAEAEAQEEAEATLAEFGDLTDKTALLFNLLIEKGMPAKAAQECAATMTDNYFFHRFQAQFRQLRR